MAEKDWAAILKDEDRIIANSDRRFRYHCYSLESMSEELTYQERSIYIQDDFTEQLMVEDFIDTVRNEKLAYGLRRLTDRQRFAKKPCHSPKLTANMVPTTYRRYAAASAAIRLTNPEPA